MPDASAESGQEPTQAIKPPWRTVRRVIDGATLELENGEKVGLLGVEAPEIDEYLGKEAAEFARQMIEGKKISLAYDRRTRNDEHGKTLAYVQILQLHVRSIDPIRLTENNILNEEIIRQGFGLAYTEHPFEQMERYLELGEKAKDEKVGLWANLACRMASMDAGKALPEDHPDVARFESLIDRVSGRFVDSRQQIFNLTVWTRKDLSEKGISEKLANIMEGVLEAAESLPRVSPLTYNQWYCSVIGEYERRRKEGLSHEDAVRALGAELETLWKQGPPAGTEER